MPQQDVVAGVEPPAGQMIDGIAIMLIEAWASMKSVKPKDGSGEPPAATTTGDARKLPSRSSARNPQRPSG